MKKFGIIVLSAFLAFTVASCKKDCEHVYDNACDVTCNECSEERTITHDWQDADCDTAKTCSVCGTTEGNALGHTWVDADCDTAKTCSVCGTTEGSALGHTWVDADCETPKTCSVCESTEGEANGHTANNDDGDCTTEVTCQHCEYVFTEGKAHDFRAEWNATGTEHWHECVNEGCQAQDSYGEHEAEEDDGDCTTHLCCKDCTWVLIEGNAEHTPNEDDGDCTTAITCQNCEYVFTEGSAHNFNSFWNATGTHHWYACANEGCQAKDSYGEHEPEEDDGDVTTEVECIHCNWTLIEAKHIYTFTALNTLGEPVPNAIVKEVSTGTESVTDENGLLELALPLGEHSFEISHNNAFYTMVGENTVVLTDENDSSTIVFEESTEMEMFTINVAYSDGTAVNNSDVHVYMYKPNSYDTHGLLAVVGSGYGCTFGYNEDKIYFVMDRDGNYGYGYYYKGGDLECDVAIEKDRPLGQTEEDAVIINALLDLPFADDTEYVLDPDYSLSAGESLYVRVDNALGRTVSIDGNNFTLEYAGNEVLAGDDGRISLIFTDVQPGDSAVFKITAKIDAVEDLTIDETGSLNAPIYVYPPYENMRTATLTFYQPGQEIYIIVDALINTGTLSASVDGVEVTIENLPERIDVEYQYVLVKVVASQAGTVTITFDMVIDEVE